MAVSCYRFRTDASRSLAACGLLLLSATAARADVQIRALRLETDGPATQLTMDLSGNAERKVFTLDKPARVVIDLPQTQLAKGLRLPDGQGVVKSVRAGSPSKQTLRLVLELEKAQVPTTRFDAQGSGGRLTVSLGRADKAATAKVAPVTAPAEDAEAPAAPAPVVRAPRSGNGGARDIVIAIDAGHGGTDPGAIGRRGTQEKDVTLAIARALARRVEAEPGMKAYLTRDGDYFVVLRDRIVKARNARADLFVSVHADSVLKQDVGGSSVYVLSDRGASSEAARWLAERENAADLKGGVKLGDKNGQLASLLLDLTQTASIGSSMEAAERVLSHLDGVGEVHKSQVQQAGFVVLKSPDIPSMLVETAYISNPGEEAKLRSAPHQEAIANAIFSGLRDYFRRNPPDGTVYAQQKGRGAMIAGNTP